MLDIIGGSVVDGAPTFNAIVICTISGLVCGLVIATAYMYKNKHSKTLAVTLVLLPAIIQIIIMLINGSIGTGIAVAGAFSLIRFRSIPGNARDIACLFFATALGFVVGMGYIFYAFIFLLIIVCVYLAMTLLRFGQGEADARILRITIPENLDYEGLFDDVFAKYVKSLELERVKTTGMGSLYELTYSVKLNTPSVPKAFIDELRCRNGNLNILISRELLEREEL